MTAATQAASAWISLVLPAAAGFWAGIQNALAGGGSFVTFPALMLAGLDPRAANVTSTVALFPGQCAAGFLGRNDAGGIGRLRLEWLAAVSLAGGALGAWLLLATPASFFAALVPYLVLFATAVFAWGSFVRRKPVREAPPRPGVAVVVQFLIAVYGGYFGGGIGILMLAALTMLGMRVRMAGATKNILGAVMNASAVAVFLLSSMVAWRPALTLGAAAVAGGLVGARMLRRVDERALRAFVVGIGLVLTVGLFLRR